MEGGHPERSQALGCIVGERIGGARSFTEDKRKQGEENAV